MLICASGPAKRLPPCHSAHSLMLPALHLSPHPQFTLLCMTYEARMSTLRHFVRHYSRCPSVSDIVLVWNNGEARAHALPQGRLVVMLSQPLQPVAGYMAMLACSMCVYRLMAATVLAPPLRSQASRPFQSAILTARCRCACAWSRSTR